MKKLFVILVVFCLATSLPLGHLCIANQRAGEDEQVTTGNGKSAARQFALAESNCSSDGNGHGYGNEKDKDKDKKENPNRNHNNKHRDVSPH